MPDPVWHNAALRELRPSGHYGRSDLERLETELERRGTLRMRALPSGLFPATSAASSLATGYNHVWVRDNVYVAYAHHLRGESDVATGVVRGLFSFFAKSRERFDAIIAGDVDPAVAMLRPHVRFDGSTMAEVSGERWSHAQNDALGYALWLFAQLVAAGVLSPDAEMIRTVALFPRYFAAIRYWEDEDSGHWEEARKQSASSIGTVVAGLEALLDASASQPTLRRLGLVPALEDLTSDLIARGRSALDAILPSECIKPSPRQQRRYDAALVFLLYPLGVVDAAMATRILEDVEHHLAGADGVRRYLGDSYFAPDYEDRLSPEDLTRDYSEDVEARDALLDEPGTEAQWCIFDSLISSYYGWLYRETGAPDARQRQRHHFDRALAQVDAEWACPELYYLRRGVRIAGPNRPLLWSQANLMTALVEMRDV